MLEKDKSSIVPHTRVPTGRDSTEDGDAAYETKEDGSTVGIPTTTRVVTE